MHYKIILESFRKAKKHLKDLSGKEPSFSSCAKYLSDKIYEINGFSFGEKSLRVLHNKSVDASTKNVEIKQPKVVDALCKFLGYKDYADFVNKNKTLKEASVDSPLKVKASSSEKFVFSALIFILITVVVIYISIDKTKWMVWQEDHYTVVPFDTEMYDINLLKLYKEERIENFRKIIPPCEYAFFNKDGSVRIWYGKNAKKVLEYFTDLGLHPETGKTLKPITQYMIDKYICEGSV